MIDRQPTLTGPALELRPMVEGDREALFAVASDPLLWAQHPAHDRWRRPVFDRFFDDGMASGGALVAIERTSGRKVGSSRYGGHDPDRDEIEIGWTFLAREHWGGRYNAEMKRLMLDHIQRVVPTVTFRVGVENRRSRRALEKIGATMRGETETRVMAGRPVEHLIYEIRRPRDAF